MRVEKVKGALKSVTKRYTQMRKKEERGRRVSRASYMYVYSDRVTIREVAFEVMEEAYMKASDNGKLPARPRQIMYAARPAILAQATADTFDDQYFTQVLIPDYVEAHAPSWANNVAWDARGHFSEPHLPELRRDRHELGLGTLEVRQYLSGRLDDVHTSVEAPHVEMRFPTRGPRHRFGAMLFIEKEGFMPLFEAVDLADRYDLAVMSTKGQSVTACRELVDELCGEYEIPLVVLHDFDKSGLSILAGFERDTRRYTWKNDIKVIDLAVRLRDVREYGIEPEPCQYHGNTASVRANLRRNGATDEEIEFLVTGQSWRSTPGQRVELNAFTSDQLVELIEKRLKEAGIAKVVPKMDTLRAAYRRAARVKYINTKLPEITREAEEYAEDLKTPRDLRRRIEQRLKESPELPWDEALAREVPEMDEARDA